MTQRILSATAILVVLMAVGCIDPSDPNQVVSVRIRGVSSPVAVPAAETLIPYDRRVIGLLVDGKARAYLLDAMSMPVELRVNPAKPDEHLELLGRHVVNDQVNGLAITVTYCDRTDCKQVFTAPSPKPIEMFVAGWDGQDMQLYCAEQTFAQGAANPPVETYPFDVMSWGEWRTKYPETDVYLGRLQSHLHWEM